MRIALFVPSWPADGAASGIVTYASYLVPALRGLGHEVFLLSLGNSKNTDPYIICLERFKDRSRISQKVLYKIIPETTHFNAISAAILAASRALVETYGVDVLEIEESFGWSYRVTRKRLLPVVVRLHGPWCLIGKFENHRGRTKLGRRREYREGLGIQGAQLVTAPSAAVLDAVRSYYDLPLLGSRVIRGPIAAAPEICLWDLKDCSRQTLLFVGRFDALKGGDLVLRAFSELALRNTRLRLTFVGSDIGLTCSDGHVRNFQSFVRSNVPASCQSQINFLGKMNHADVMRLRRNHFATIVASQYETMGYAVLEAMSSGCPIVATAVGGIPELITNQKNGLLVPSHDARALAAACQILLDDPALAERLGRQAWQDCRDRYGPESMARETVAAYEEAIDVFESRNTT
jgi:glycosyltransferase involved in cell wall biosynthesis